MTESPSPLGTALDLLLYAPVGLALTAAEEIPKLATKGRAQLEGQLTMARVVGQFAVAQGRKELKKRLTTPTPSRPDTRGTTATGARSATRPRRESDTAPEAPPPRSRVAQGEVSYEDLLAAPGTEVASAPRAAAEAGAGAEASPPADLGGRYGHAGSRPGEVPSPRTSGGEDAGSLHPAARSLAIPGYDSLAASQVVQRLAGLSKDELEAVGAYEAAHRSRRTILSRIRQLQGS